MKKNLTFLFLSFWFLSFGQNTVGVTSYNLNALQEGYNLLFPHNQGNVYLLDNCGEIVNSWEDDDSTPGNSAYILENGDLVKCKRLKTNPGDDPIWAGGGGAFIEIRGWNNELKYSFFQNDTFKRIHHDIAPMPNGNILAISWELITLDQMLAAGVDTSVLGVEKFWSDYILEIDPNDDSVVWEWHAWDHLIQDFDESKLDFGVVNNQPERINVNYNTHTNTPDWLHSNSIDYNPVLDQIVLSVPHFDEFWIIDHSTTTEEARGSTGGNANRGGDLLYRWGNPSTYNFQKGFDQRLFFQHDVHWVKPNAEEGDPDFGLVLLFNNRISPQSETAYFETNFDDLSQSYPALDSVENQREFRKIITHPLSIEMASSQSVSSAQRLQNGNTLICAGRWGYTYEITESDEIVWEYRVPLVAGELVDQETIINNGENFTFRMKRYSNDYPAFSNKDLSPKGYLELSPNVDFCNLPVSIDEVVSDNLIRILPNPTRDYLLVTSNELEIDFLEIFSSNGSEINIDYLLNSENKLDVSGLEPGLYWIRVNRKIWERFIKI